MAVETNIEALLAKDGFSCSCGKAHYAKVSRVLIDFGALNKIPELIGQYNAKKIFVFFDENTYKAAGERVLQILQAANIAYKTYCFPGERFEPDERSVGSAVMHFDPSCDMVITVGTGCLNDIGKIVANMAKKPYMIVGTAPSMDGYSSATSSMIRDGLKVSLDSKCPDIVVGDLDVLAASPMRMIQAGIGDMAAKYVSIGEWQLSRVINGEYYCGDVADMVSAALKKCADNASGIMKRDPQAVRAVMEGMVLAGIAANYAGISRPVSGMEHYISHIWDMRALEFDSPSDLHGIQCGVATLLTLKVFDYVKKIVPDKDKALAYVKRFDFNAYKAYLSENLGAGADSMIANEAKEGKYDPDKHAKRLDVILDKYDEIIAIINAMPTYDEVYATLSAAGFPLTAEELGFSKKEIHDAFLMAKDIRDKYVVSRLLWDLGLLEEAADELFPC